MNTQELLNVLKICGATFFGVLAMHGYMTKDQASAIMSDLMTIVPAAISLGGIVWSIYAHWNMKKVPENAVAIAPHAPADAAAPIGANAAGKVVGILLIAFALLFLLAGGAQAQVRLHPPAVTGDPVADIKTDLGIKPAAKSAGSISTSSGKPCDINLFANLSITSVVTDIQNCVGSVVAAGASPFVADIQAALDSATMAKDGTAIACLTPALAIATAAKGTPAVPAVMTNGAITTPEVPAVYPGPILIFQKYREFVTAGGPSNCKTAVQSTISGTVASGL